MRAELPLDQRILVDSEEGVLVHHAGPRPDGLAGRATFRLPGEGLEDVVDARERDLLEDVLAHERMVPDQLRIEDVPGFRMKGEERPLVVVPRHLRVRPAEPDPANRRLSSIRIRFELPRGSYATLVVKRLVARSPEELERERKRRAAGGRGRTGRAGGGQARRDPRRGDERPGEKRHGEERRGGKRPGEKRHGGKR